MEKAKASSEYRIIEKEDYSSFTLLSPLFEINQIPEELYFTGNEKLLRKMGSDYKVLCVVGSRKISSYGREVIDFLLSGLANEKIIIVSGLALGADTLAHKAALKYNLPTLALPGSGLSDEVLYPQANIKLKEEILLAGGALMSEYAPDAKSQIYYFPARNRIMAALADLVLIIEAEERSGTQITARLALEYNKDVAIVPGSIFSANSRGTAKLFKDGAYPVTCAQDILELLHINNTSATLFENDNKKDNFDLENIKGLTESEKIIMNLLRAPMQKDELIESSGLLAHETLIAITNLEASGYIKDNYGELIRVR